MIKAKWCPQRDLAFEDTKLISSRDEEIMVKA